MLLLLERVEERHDLEDFFLRQAIAERLHRARAAGRRLHVLHITTGDEIPLLAEAMHLRAVLCRAFALSSA